jgi:hypothetical protein
MSFEESKIIYEILLTLFAAIDMVTWAVAR